MQKMIPIHETCPYYDKGKHKCSRVGCHLLTPCLLFNPLYRTQLTRVSKKGRKQ